MKKMLFVIIVLVLYSCIKEAPEGRGDYAYVNQSGVKVAIVGALSIDYKYSYNNYPDSLVLKNNESFTYTGRGGSGIPFSGANTPIKIYFDDEVRMVYHNLDFNNRNPLREKGYEIERPDKYWRILTYTVTEEDYQYALEHGEVVEKTE